MAEKTAINSKPIPDGDAASVKSSLKMINETPKNETKRPIRFILLSFSCKNQYARNGVNTGIVAIINALIEADTR